MVEIIIQSLGHLKWHVIDDWRVLKMERKSQGQAESWLSVGFLLLQVCSLESSSKILSTLDQSFNSFFSVLCLDFKNALCEKNHIGTSKVV